MGIKFKYDAVAVPPSSEKTTMEFGQKLVQQQRDQDQRTKLQQEQLKYDAQQQGYDRLFTWNRDAMQNEMAFRKEGRDNQLLAEQQRRADFQAARNRMDTHAKDALSNPNLPPELRQKIQNLINGKMAVLGSDYNQTQQQQFLDQYNSELAALLSEIPASPPPPSPDDDMASGIATFDGVKYQKNPKTGVWEPLKTGEQSGSPSDKGSSGKQPPQRFTSADDAFAADEKMLDKYMDKAAKWLTDDEGVRLPKVAPDAEGKGAVQYTPEEYQKKQRELAQKLYDIDHGLGTPTPAAPKAPDPVSRAALAQGLGIPYQEDPRPENPPEMRSILEAPPAAGSPPVPPTAGTPSALPATGQPTPAAPQGPAAGSPPVPPTAGTPSAPPATGQPTPAAPQGPAAGQPTGPGAEQYQWVTPSNGGKGFWYSGDPSKLNEPLSPGEGPVPAAPPRDDWSGIMNPQAKAPTQSPQAGGKPAQSQQPQTQQSPPVSPDFNALASSAKSDVDRSIVTGIQKIYQGGTPDIQAAISIMLNPSAEETDIGAAVLYLQQKGINVNELTGNSKRPPGNTTPGLPSGRPIALGI